MRVFSAFARLRFYFACLGLFLRISELSLVLESSENVPNGLRSKLIFRPENKFIFFFRGRPRKMFQLAVFSFFRAEKKSAWIFRTEKYFFRRNKILFRAEKIKKRKIPFGTKVCSAEKTSVRRLPRPQDFFEKTDVTWLLSQCSHSSAMEGFGGKFASD